MSTVSAPRQAATLQILIGMELVISPNVAALELAIESIHALHSQKRKKTSRSSWRQSAEYGASSLLKLFPSLDPALLEETGNILRQASRPRPATEAARLLSDAMNLSDFGIHGLLQKALRMGAAGSDLAQLLESFRQQEQYGYWEVRLKEDFHFEPVRQLAAQRLEHLRKVSLMLKKEMDASG